MGIPPAVTEGIQRRVPERSHAHLGVIAPCQPAPHPQSRRQGGPQSGQGVPPALSPEPAQPDSVEQYNQHTAYTHQPGGEVGDQQGCRGERQRGDAAEECSQRALSAQGNQQSGKRYRQEQDGVDKKIVDGQSPPIPQPGGRYQKKTQTEDGHCRCRHPPAAEEEGIVGEPEAHQHPHGQHQPHGLPPEIVDGCTIPGNLAGQQLKRQPDAQQHRHRQRQPPAAPGPVEPIQLPAHRLRLPHLGHGGGQGLAGALPLCLKGGGLVGDVVGQLPQQGPPRPLPADLGPHRLQVFAQTITRHSSHPPPARHAPRRRRRTTPPAVRPGPPGPPG